jgi:hypothetical protein
MKRFIVFFLSACLLWVAQAQAQIEGFTAGHLSGGKEVYIRFYVHDIGSEFETPTFSISLDEGKSYQNLLKSFRDDFNPEKGVQPGVNMFVWEAEKDLPNTFVNPAFIKMSIKVTSEDKASFEYLGGDVPAVIVNEPVEAFRLIQFVSGQSKVSYASSSELTIAPGRYVGKSIEDLLAQLDPNFWTPPRKEDEEVDRPQPGKEQDGEYIPPEDLDGFKFEGEVIVYSDLPEVSRGEPLTQEVDMKREIEGKTDVKETMEPPVLDIRGSSMLVDFLLFQDQVFFGKSVILDEPNRINFIPVEFDNLPTEPGISRVEDFGTVWERGDILIGFYDQKGLYDLAVVNDPLITLAHDDKAEHRLIKQTVGTAGVVANIDDSFSHVVVWRAEISNAKNPLAHLEDFKLFEEEHLNLRLRLSNDELKRGQTELGQGNDGNVFGPRNHTNSPAPLNKIWNSGSKSSKYNVVITGDGFANTNADNQKMQDWLNDHVIEGIAKSDIQPSYFNAVNFYFLDAKSQDSGITESRVVIVPKEDIGDFTSRDDYLTHKEEDDDNFRVYLVDGDEQNTAWSFASADWSACWRIQMEGNSGWDHLTDSVSARFGGKPDEIWIIQNDGRGGCASSANGIRILTISDASSVNTLLHEWGHTFGRLGDEYTRQKPYAGGADGKVNLYEASAWNGTWTGLRSKWKRWVPSFRPLPTAASNVALNDTDVGLFLGGHYATNGVYRPVQSGRMDSNSPLNSPLGNTELRLKAYNYREQDFRENFLLDANNDGFTDVLVQDDRQVGLYLSDERDPGPDDPVSGAPLRSVSGVIEPTWFATDILSGSGSSWEFRKSDNIATGDFTGDGLQDFFVHNPTAWVRPYIGLLKSTGSGFDVVRRYDDTLPSWQMTSGDKIFSSDLTGDGRNELIIFNGDNWAIPYLGVWRVNEANQLVLLRRYDQYLPGWEMGRKETFQFVDIDGDEAKDIVAINTHSWAKVHMHTYVKVGNGGSLVDRFYGQIDRGIKWNINRKDHYFFGDWNGDGRMALGIFNGRSFSTEFLGLFRSSSGGSFSGLNLHSDSVNGWNFRPNDEIYRFNKEGDDVDDLIVYNHSNWGSKEYLGILSNDGKGSLSGNWQEGWIGGWNLGDVDQLKVVDFRGSSNWDDIFIFNKNWFGLLRGKKYSFALESIYHKWIQNHRYHGSNLY